MDVLEQTWLFISKSSFFSSVAQAAAPHPHGVRTRSSTMSQEQVEAKIVDLHAKWTALRDAGGSGGSAQRAELQAGLKAVELDLEDLEDALSIAKGDRTQEKESVDRREAYIAAARSRLALVAESLAGSARSAGTTQATELAASPSSTQAAAPHTPATPATPVPPAPPDDPVPKCSVPKCSVM